jgi:hypothetical protein
MPALQLGNPVVLLVPMKADNRPLCHLCRHHSHSPIAISKAIQRKNAYRGSAITEESPL